MSGKKKGLGRGLSALFGDDTAKKPTQSNKELFEVSIGVVVLLQALNPRASAATLTIP